MDYVKCRPKIKDDNAKTNNNKVNNDNDINVNNTTGTSSKNKR